MAKQDYSKYQQGVINRYYENMDTIMLQKLQELVTDLYLAMDTPKEEKMWERVEKAMVKLKVPNQIMEHILVKRDVKVLAMNVEQWLKKKG
ncbi:MAG: hypothetical protein K9M57_00855 [Phycisphaerae bacterium]|nr:hypothetical protein [Phycisphaerae bacterium]